MSRKTWLVTALAVPALALALAACGGGEEEAAGGETVTVQLGELNASGQSGTATLTSAGEDSTKVVVELSNAPAEPQPAHIHPGSCQDLDPTPAYALASLEGGRSESTVQASLDELRSGAFAVNVHASEADLATYVACGNVSGAAAGGGGEEEEEGGYRY